MAGSEPVRTFSTYGLLLTIPTEFGSWHNVRPLELREHIGITWGAEVWVFGGSFSISKKGLLNCLFEKQRKHDVCNAKSLVFGSRRCIATRNTGPMEGGIRCSHYHYKLYNISYIP